MKKVLIYVTLFFILITASNKGIDYSVAKQVEEQSPYYLCFASIGVNSLELRLDSWAKIKTTSNALELNAYLINILNCLSLPEKTELINFERKPGFTTLSYQIRHEGVSYHFILESNEVNQETYIIINLITENEAQLKDIVKKLNAITGLKWTYYYQYAGQLNMSLSVDSRAELLNVMFKNLNVQEVDAYMNENSLSKSGYSKKLAKSAPQVKVDNKVINVQIAIRHDKTHNVTKIILGSPLILDDY